MKKLLFLLLSLFTISIITSCEPDRKVAEKDKVYSVVKSVKPITTIDTIVIQHVKRPHTAGNSILGATAGYLLTGGLGGALLGGGAGYAVSDKETQAWNETSITRTTIYYYELENGYQFGSKVFYPVGYKYCIN